MLNPHIQLLSTAAFHMHFISEMMQRAIGTLNDNGHRPTQTNTNSIFSRIAG
jgi:hypothetical protein